MYDEYLKKLDDAGKIRNLKERSISCYHNYVAYFLNYVGKDPKELTCHDVRDFLLSKKGEGLKSTTLNLSLLPTDTEFTLSHTGETVDRAYLP